MILSELERFRDRLGKTRLRVLDFGGADGSLARAIELYEVETHYDVVLVDVDAGAIKSAKRRAPLVEALVIGDQPPLPLPDGAVDAVVSSDVFEHIPRPFRQLWADELRRVGPSLQIHTVPCDEPRSGYVSVATDRAFASWHQSRFQRDERWTSEHLTLGPPSLSELMQMFPGGTVQGTVNADVWLTIMRNDFSTSRRWHQVRNALWHPLLYQARGSQAPFKGCFIVRAGHE